MYCWVHFAKNILRTCANGLCGPIGVSFSCVAFACLATEWCQPHKLSRKWPLLALGDWKTGYFFLRYLEGLSKVTGIFFSGRVWTLSPVHWVDTGSSPSLPMSLIVWIKEINFIEVFGCINTTFPFYLRILSSFLLDTGNFSLVL